MTDIFSLEFLKAKYGDCLLLHYGTEDEPRLIVIDGGPAGVYRDVLKPRLQAIRDQRGGNQLEIRMVMVSHIDEDHVYGVAQWFREMATAQDKRRAPDYDVLTLWHNSFDDLIAKTGTTSALALAAGASPTAAASSIALDAGEFRDVDHESGGASAIVASVGQGRALRRDANKLAINMNSGFDDLVQFDAAAKPVPVSPGLTFTVLGPRKTELDELRKQWKTELPEILRKEQEKDKKARATQFIDDSIPNLSSIVVLATFGGKTMLLTGDARGDYIMKSARDLPGLLTDGKLPVDVLKVPHHGSYRNSGEEFFEMFPATHYVISAEGDGKHPNPAQETFDELYKGRPAGPYTVWLTNQPPPGVEPTHGKPPNVVVKILPEKSSGLIHLLTEFQP